MTLVIVFFAGVYIGGLIVTLVITKGGRANKGVTALLWPWWLARCFLI